MKVKDIITRGVRSCRPETSIADAAWSMWEADCGVLPVLDEGGKVVGMITDRDIAIAAATQCRPVGQILVRDVIGARVHACMPGDEIRDVLRTMRQEKLRRLPVVDGEGSLKGILSLNDVARFAVSERAARPGEVTYEDLALTLKAVGEHRLPPPEGRLLEAAAVLSAAKAR